MTRWETFEVTHEHIKLLQRMYVGWQNCEYGAPEIDPKRPYGNSDVQSDIIKILEWDKGPTCKNCGESMQQDREQLEDKASKIHKDMKTVLQILLQHPTNFLMGIYTRDEGHSIWRRWNRSRYI